MELKFNYTVELQDKSRINDTVFDIYIKQGNPEKKGEFSRMNITWEAINFEYNEIYIQLNIPVPENVTKDSFKRDFVVVNVRNESMAYHLFRSPSQQRLHRRFYKLERTIRKQLKRDTLSEVSVGASSAAALGMAGLITVVVIVGLLTKGKEATRHLMNMMITLQFIVFQAILRFNIPANLANFIETILAVLSFDVLDTFVDWEEQPVVEFDFERHE